MHACHGSMNKCDQPNGILLNLNPLEVQAQLGVNMVTLHYIFSSNYKRENYDQSISTLMKLSSLKSWISFIQFEDQEVDILFGNDYYYTHKII